MSKSLQVSRSKYRVVISDVLPYERPVFFTNRYFARFLKYYGIQCHEDKLVATKHVDTVGLDLFLRVMGGEAGAERQCFQYHITKEGHGKGRCLTVIHPYHQVKMVDFYDRYKTLLVYFCKRSNYSIRFPHKIASYQKQQRGFHKIMSDEENPADTKESIKHFFAYRHYKNINFFYGDYRFLRAEKRFRRMWKNDLKECFESIDPKSLSRALFGQDMADCPGSMAADFCQLHRKFKNRTEGIVIGPEFSRLYAEMILQQVDLDTERRLRRDGILRDRDYVFYRYVDDGFLFYDEDVTKQKFEASYTDSLAAYGQTISGKKQKDFAGRPFLESISTAKVQLLRIVDERFQNRLETFKGFVKMQDNRVDTPTCIDYKSFINEVRSVLYRCSEQISYKDIASFLLGIIQKRIVGLLAAFNNLYREYSKSFEEGCLSNNGLQIKERYERDFISFCMEVVEILFYLLACDLRMSTSIKVVSAINKLQMFVRGRYIIDDETLSAKFPLTVIGNLDDKISDEIASLMLNTQPKDFNLMEILNVLEVEKVMQKKNQISPSTLHNFLGRLSEGSKCLNFFTVFELIHFIKRQDGYDGVKEKLYRWIQLKLEILRNPRNSDTEAVLTFMEAMCCPWIDSNQKMEFARAIYGDSAKEVCRFAAKQRQIFIQWHDYRLTEAIQQINSSEVY